MNINYNKENTATLVKMLNADDWHIWLMEAYTSDYQIFKPFLLEREQEFIEILPGLRKELQSSQLRQLKYQTVKFLEEASIYDFKDLSYCIELLEISKIILGDDIYNLLNTSFNFLVKNLPNESNIADIHHIEKTTYLKTLSAWLYEYKNDLILNNRKPDHEILNQIRNNLFGQKGLFNSLVYDTDLAEFKGLSIYKFILRLILSPNLWFGSLTSILKEINSNLTKEIFRILNLFCENHIISKAMFTRSIINALKTNQVDIVTLIKENTSLPKSYFPAINIACKLSIIQTTGEHKTDISTSPSSFSELEDIKKDVEYRIENQGKVIDLKTPEEAIHNYTSSKY